MSISRLDTAITPVTERILEWKNVFLVGIKGVGMTSLAVLLQQAGVNVQGADIAESFVTDALLTQSGISVADFASAKLPEDVEGVIFSGAHQGSNHLLVKQARSRGIPCLTLAEAVGALSNSKKTIVTCGVGGKSTTSAWLSLMLTRAGLEPAFSVGVGTIPDLGTSGRWGEGEWFVVEGDEYVSDPSQQRVVPRFLHLNPHAVLCTGISYDHPDVYSSEDDTCRAFGALWQRIPADGVLVTRADDRLTEAVLEQTALQAKVIRVGEADSLSSDVVVRFTPTATGTKIQLTWNESRQEIQAETRLLGLHNAWNAALSIVLAKEINVDTDAIVTAVHEFHSTPRRLEWKGITPNGWRCYDDYAHHPKELTAISQTLKQWFPNEQIVVAFQPHTFSRTKVLWDDFVKALANFPGKVFVLPIFASAREASDASVSVESLVAEVQSAGADAHFTPSVQDLLKYVQNTPGPGVFITLGAGDIYIVYEHTVLNTD